MPEGRITTRDLLERLKEQGLVDEAGIDHARKQLAGDESDADMPWYVKALMGFGAWVAAVFFLFFLELADLISGEPGTRLVVGLLLIAGATALRYFINHVFPAQLALATSMAGHVLTFWGVGELAGNVWGPLVAAAALWCPLYLLNRDPVHRFLSSLLVPSLLTAWLLDAELHHGLHAVVAAEMIGLWLLLGIRDMRTALRPVVFALAFSLPVTVMFVVFPEVKLETAEWPSTIILALGVAWLCLSIAREGEKVLTEPLVLAIAGITLLGVVATPGILVAMGLMVLGYAREERIILGMGILFLPAFMIAYYYDMDVDLLVKSGILAASGAVLMGARAYMHFRPWARENAQ